MRSARPLAILGLVTLAAGVACAGGGAHPPASAASPAAGGAASRPAARPLAALAAQRVIVVPVQSLRAGDSLGWSGSLPSAREYLSKLDDEIAFAIVERGLKSAWVAAPDVARSARRNAPYMPDVYALALEPLRAVERRPDDLLREPLAGQLRALVALHDARYAVVPSELRFEPRNGTGRAVLRVAVVEPRVARLVWTGEVASDPASALSPAIGASLAGHLLDLVIAAP